MAWVTKENIDSKKPLIKALCKEYGVKATLSGTNDYSMKLTIASGSIDFVGNNIEKINSDYHTSAENKLKSIAYIKRGNYIQTHHYYFERAFSGKALEFLQKAKKIMQEGNHDRSDIQTDYFDVGWYIRIDIGRWNKPYELIIGLKIR